jgi:hypothetical protein
MENNNNQAVYVIDTYSKIRNNDDVCFTFSLYNREYCLRKVEELEWGQPVFKNQSIEEEHPYYYIYSTIDEAKAFIRKMKRIEGTRY